MGLWSIGNRASHRGTGQDIQQVRKQDSSLILLPETMTLFSSRPRAVSCDISTLALNESLKHQSMLHSPMPGRTYSVMIVISHLLSSISVRVLIRVWIFRVASSRMIPKDFFQAKAAVDPIVPLSPVLMSMVRGNQLRLAQKLSRLSGAEARLLWLVRSIRACQGYEAVIVPATYES